MSCLGDRLTALVDGELDPDARERALVHLVGCDGCRAEAEALRGLKRRLNALRDPRPGGDLLGRLYGMAEAPPQQPVKPVERTGPPRPPQAAPGVPAPSDELLRRLYRMDEPPADRRARTAARRPADSRPLRGRREPQRRRLPRARYFVAGAATLAALGAGSTPYVNTAPARVQKVSPGMHQVSVHNGGGISQVRLPRRQDESKR